jgi:hypothetical protein
VGTIAERFALGRAATTESNLGAPSQTICLAFLIDDLHFTINEQRPIIYDGHLNVWHSILRSKFVKFLAHFFGDLSDVLESG